MARKCGGTGCPYGYGHHDEHVRAARLGWQRRMQGEAQYVGDAFGGGYEVHRHKAHFILRNKADDAHFELSRSEYAELAKQMRIDREAAKKEKQYQNELARLQKHIDRENAPKQGTLAEGAKMLKAHQVAQRKAERVEKAQAREVEKYKRQSARIERDMYYSAIREMLGSVKIKHYKANPHTKKIPEFEEYQSIPKMFRAKKGESGLTPDDLAAHLAEHAPWLGIERDSDLYTAFNKLARNRQNRLGH